MKYAGRKMYQRKINCVPKLVTSRPYCYIAKIIIGKGFSLRCSLFSVLVSLRSLRLNNQLMCIIIKIYFFLKTPILIYFQFISLQKRFSKNLSCQTRGVAYMYLRAVAFPGNYCSILFYFRQKENKCFSLTLIQFF